MMLYCVRKAKRKVLPDEDRELPERFRRGQNTGKRGAFRTSIILACSSGKMIMEIALKGEYYNIPMGMTHAY